MNIDDIKLFIEINNNRNISAAAHALLFAQSTVSRRLSMLEKELNIKLFIRGKGYEELALTQAGERFLLLAEQIIALADEACLLHENSSIRRLSVAAPDSIASYAVNDFFYRLLRSNQAWDLEIAVHDSIQIFDMVANRMKDIGLTNGEAPYPELNSVLMFQENFVVMRRGEVPSQPQVVHPSDLKAHHEIFQIFSPEYHHWHNFWWKPSLAKIRVNMAKFTAGFLHDREDWAILPESVARALLPPDGYLSQFSDPPPPRRCYFVTHKKPRPDRAELIHEFYQQLRDFLAENERVTL